MKKKSLPFTLFFLPFRLLEDLILITFVILLSQSSVQILLVSWFWLQLFWSEGWRFSGVGGERRAIVWPSAHPHLLHTAANPERIASWVKHTCSTLHILGQFCSFVWPCVCGFSVCSISQKNPFFMYYLYLLWCNNFLICITIAMVPQRNRTH